MNIRQRIARLSFCLLAWCTLAVAPTFAQSITHVPLFTIHGDSLDEQFGKSVSGAGDVNGDGFADLIAGAPDELNDGIGSARVYSGTDGSLLYNFVGNSPGDLFGFSVSGAGDVNADGFADLIVGAPSNDRNNSPFGSARVLSGIDGSVLYTFDGDPTTDFFSRDLSGAGDVNGDGFADLIVGVPLNNSVRVFSGVDGSVLYNFFGDSTGDLFGRKVSGAGDVNGDGFDDLIVGAPLDDNNGQNSGIARVFSGVDGSVLYSFEGDSANDGFGRPVSGAGDVNGDGFADLIVGAAGDDNNGNGSGSARVFSGVDGSVLYTFDGDPSAFPILGDAFGSSVSGAGDVNGDGFADLIVGAPSDDPNGQNSGSARVFSGIDGSILYTFDGDGSSDGFLGDNFGVEVSGAGDVNGDDVADFFVGALRGGTNNGGYVRLFVSQITIPFVLGDCNIDGRVGFDDIPFFIDILLSDNFLEQADVFEDGEVNFMDIPAFIEVLLAG